MERIPRHVGFIVDGNRRWAKSRGLPGFMGHAESAKVAFKVFEACFEEGVEEISAWFFSTENWKREGAEIAKIMELIPQSLQAYLPQAHAHRVQLRHLGRKDRLGASLLTALKEAEDATAGYEGRRINLCIDHGGQDEIVRGIQAMLRDGLEPATLNAETVGRYLDSSHCLPLDLIVRTGGDVRLSGFLLWLSAYSELHFEPDPFPALTPARTREIIGKYAGRERRFGGNAAAA